MTTKVGSPKRARRVPVELEGDSESDSTVQSKLAPKGIPKDSPIQKPDEAKSESESECEETEESDFDDAAVVRIAGKLECLADLLESDPKNVNPDSDPYSIKKCLNILRELPGLEIGSKEYFLAARLMAKPVCREMLVAIKEPHLQLTWLNFIISRDM